MDKAGDKNSIDPTQNPAPIVAESEAASRVYRGKYSDSPNPEPSRIYYPKNYQGERNGAGVVTDAGASSSVPEPSISAAEIRANSVTNTNSGTTASGGAAITPTINPTINTTGR